MATTDKDKPKVHSSYSALEAETDSPEPYVYTTKTSKRVTFPDPGALPFDEAEQWMVDISKMSRNADVFKKWLAEQDYEALLADRLTLRQLMTLMTKVQTHYGSIFGDEGE